MIFKAFLFRSIAEKGPSAEEKITSLEAVVSTYEAKVNGLENEIETQREQYEKKLLEFAQRFVRKPQILLDGILSIFTFVPFPDWKP